MKNNISVMVIIGIMFLTGCAETYSVEDRAIIRVAGYDFVDEDRLKATVAVPQYGRGESSGTPTEKFQSAVDHSVKEAHENIQRKLSKPISIGKLELSLFNEELAKNGLKNMIDFLGRDPIIGRNILLSVVKGETQGLIEAKYSESETTSKYITGLIKQNINQSNFPETNLHKFLYAYYADGMDPFLPLIKRTDSQVEIDGIAFFDGAKMVHSLPYSEAFNFKIMKQDFNRGTKGIKYKEEHIVLENIGSRVTYHVIDGIEHPKFLLDIKIKGFINEVQNINLMLNGPVIKSMEKDFEKSLQAQCIEMIERFQELKIDPLGLGNDLKNRREHFDLKKWEDVYPTVPVDVKIDVEIIETGITS
ncbi:Ger(x)C family spore germination protein [Oceanobacillus jordanicus]|uniref:Ger(X)C family spore germination protein n=1 Tax=Oceanobacillus jordanicus TaxID=2867266 RepID=A0AAW5B6N1_9BACI|nr:Ger(x)C family spore germination protein [Oceanobacillus jordanicus]MCG3420061.1 Ger(x)C family spore germination protein [Oceanobacillus jordanicus]